VVGRGAIVNERTDAPQWSPLRRLDQDHVGAEVREQLSAIVAPATAKIEHAQAGQSILGAV
jgi:hypothetical protein